MDGFGFRAARLCQLCRSAAAGSAQHAAVRPGRKQRVRPRPMRGLHIGVGIALSKEASGARGAARVLFVALCLGLASRASSARSTQQPVLGPYGSQWDATAPADQARFMLRAARGRAEAAEREAQFTAPSGTFYNIKENVRAMAEASREAAKRLAAEMLAGHAGQGEPGLDAAVPDTSHRRSAALCDGFRVALDLHDGGVPELLQDDDLAGMGIPVDSMDLPGVTGGVDSAGAPEAGHACLIPTAVCGEGRDASVRFDWGLQRQRFNSVSCDPSPELVGHAFLPVNRLVPADDKWAGLARVGDDGQHCDGAGDERRGCGAAFDGPRPADRLAAPMSDSFLKEARQRTLSFGRATAMDEMPLARLLFVRVLRAALDAAYRKDRDTLSVQHMASLHHGDV